MPHFAIKLLEGKTEEQKQLLAKALVKTAQQIIGYNDDAYSVSIQDVNQEDWFARVYPNDIMANKDILYKEPGY